MEGEAGRLQRLAQMERRLSPSIVQSALALFQGSSLLIVRIIEHYAPSPIQSCLISLYLLPPPSNYEPYEEGHH